MNEKREAATHIESELHISRFQGVSSQAKNEELPFRHVDYDRHHWSDAALGDDDFVNFTTRQPTEDASIHHQGIAFTIDGSLPASFRTPTAPRLDFTTLGTGIQLAPTKKPHRPKKKKDTPRPEAEPSSKIVDSLLLVLTPAPPQDPAVPPSKHKSRRELKVKATLTPETEDEAQLTVSTRKDDLKIEPMVVTAAEDSLRSSPHEEFGHVLQFDKNRDFGKQRFVPRLFGIETIRE